MKTIFAFGILLMAVKADPPAAGSIKYRYCDQLPKLTDDVRQIYTKFSGRILKYISLNPEEICAVAEYDGTNHIKTIITKGVPVSWTQKIERPGVWRTKNLLTGAYVWDFIFAYNATNDGGFFCLFICDEDGGQTYLKRLHCDITSVDYIPQVDRAMQNQRPLLRDDQYLFKCPVKNLTDYYSNWKEKSYKREIFEYQN